MTQPAPSLLHPMRVIAPAHVSLMRVKKSMHCLFMTPIVWDTGTKKMLEQKHQISLIFANLLLALILYLPSE